MKASFRGLYFRVQAPVVFVLCMLYGILELQVSLGILSILLITRHAAPVAAGRLYILRSSTATKYELIIDYLVEIASRC